MKISVIIATYNRSDRLRLALKSLDEMAAPSGVCWELIIIDNNSSDSTKEVCNEFQQKNTLIFKYIFEPRQGKAYALNEGIREATGDILVFTDDDAIADKYWLTSILKEFKNDVSIAGIGGRVELFNENDKCVTIRTSKDKITFSSPRQLRNPPIIGVNMAFKRRVFDEVGKMDLSFGPGSRIGAFIDAEFIYRVFKKGFKIIYTPDVLVYHNHGRRTEKEVQALNRRYMIGRGAFYCKYILRGDIKIVTMAFHETFNILVSLIKNLIGGRPIKKNLRGLCYLMTGALYKVTDI